MSMGLLPPPPPPPLLLGAVLLLLAADGGSSSARLPKPPHCSVPVKPCPSHAGSFYCPANPDPHQCAEAAAGNTTCFRGTSCAAHYSANGMGCCPLDNAVCCPNSQTCCPAGSTCADTGTYLTKCMKGGAEVEAGLSVCKPGAPNPMSTTLPNVLIIGDSVSIGYTPHVTAHMAKVALVQHSPFDVSDGGAEETAYGIRCLDFFLRSPAGALHKPEVIMFNWGLHDGPLGNSTVPGQAGLPDVYATQLENITLQLKQKQPQAKLLFALSSAYMCAAKNDGSVVNLNNQAAAVMAKHSVPTINLHDAIVEECGPAPATPDTKHKCFNESNCFCPHCPQANGVGYEYLASKIIAPALTKLLPKSK
jgi:hypothetical protein